MKHRWYQPLGMLLLLLAAALLLSVAAFAANPTPMDVSWDYDEAEGELRLHCTRADPEGSTVFNQPAKPDYAAAVRILWLTGEVETIGAKAFQDFPNIETLIIDAPGLQKVSNSNAFSNCKKIARIFYLGETSGTVIASIGPSGAERIHAGDETELCRVRVADCEHGRIVTDAGDYVKTGTEVLVSLLPEGGYEPGYVYGGTEVTAHRRIITEDVTFRAECDLSYRELLSENSWGECGARAGWYIYKDGEGAQLLIMGIRGLTAYSSASKYPWYAYRDAVTTLTVDGGVTTIPANAFSLTALSEALLGEDVTGIGASAFLNCPQIRRFTVAAGNRAYASDYWGALYSKGYQTLICYPPAAEYQYYCVKGIAAKVSDNAFYNCTRLVTLNIPNKNTAITAKAFYPNFNNLLVCVHRGSTAETNLGTRNVRIIEDYQPGSMMIQHLPERLSFEAGAEPVYENLYFVAEHQGITILLDELDYDLSLSGSDAGIQDVTAVYHQKKLNGDSLTETFHVRFLKPEEDRSILEYRLESGYADREDLKALAAFYGFNGQMLEAAQAELVDNVTEPACNDLRCAVSVPKTLLGGEAQRLKLFLTDGFSPLKTPVVDEWLPAPTLLRWGTVHYTDRSGRAATAARPGQISFRSAEDGDGVYRISVYRLEDGGETLVYSAYAWDMWGSSYANEQEFLRSISGYGSGDYVFEVVNEAVRGERVHSSKAVRSGVFHYETPETTLSPCTELFWSTDGNSLSWTLPEDTSHYGGYTITVYYRRWADSPLRTVGSQCYFFDAGESNLEDDFAGIGRGAFFPMNERRAGYYSFTVTVETDDVTAANRSAESEMSDFYYYLGN